MERGEEEGSSTTKLNFFFSRERERKTERQKESRERERWSL